MVEPLDIAIAVHNLCEAELIPKGVSPEHGVDMHSDTTGLYARAINESGLDVSGEQVMEAIILAAEWDKNSPWPGHPHPDLVIAKLKVGFIASIC